jgi:carbamoyl-phosphate synthase small subunit
MSARICKLALEDGTVFTGQGFGASGTHDGEVCFNTSMTGYQEILTDPSYAGQIVTMTYPLIGNYGINLEDVESRAPQVEGFVIKELAQRRSNFRATGSLEEYLERHGVVAIEGVDTRAITRKLRIKGAMNGCLSTEILDDAELVARARAWPGLVGRDLVKNVAPREPFEWSKGFESPFAMDARGNPKRHKVLAMDCGMKQNILRNLVEAGCDVTVLPPNTPAKAILEHKPDGVFLSNGPGDPAALGYAVRHARDLVDSGVPVFGICLGHQILSLAMGGETFKLKFGHRGANHPVKDLQTGKVEITSQNHGFAVDVDSMQGRAVLSHVSLNDKTVEGMRHGELPVFSVQYHPEASPGPNDASYLFDRFCTLMQER